MSQPLRVPYRTVAEWEVRSARACANPFTDVTVEGVFTSPSG